VGFPIIAIQLGIQIGLWAISRYLLRDDVEHLPKTQPEGITFAQNTIGSPHAYIAGTVRIDSPTLIWHGNHAVSTYHDFTTYDADLLLVLGVPPWDSADAPWGSWRSGTTAPKVRRFWYGGKSFPPSGRLVLRHGEWEFARALDGFLASIEFFDGRADQTLVGSKTHKAFTTAGVQASDIPGYRHKMLLGVIAGGSDFGTVGQSPRVAAMGVEVSAVGPQCIGLVDQFDQRFGLDANPAWVIYDLLCRPVYGIGIDPDDVDLDSFQAAADTLEDEAHGCSIVVQQMTDAPRVFADLLSQIDAVLYEAPSTGKIKLRLIRRDYDVEDLPVMNADNVVERPRVEDLHSRECPNEVRVNFTNRARDYKPDTVPSPVRPAGTDFNSRRRWTEFNAPGCMNAELAARIAVRELNVIGQPLRTITAKVNREFYALELGDAVLVDLEQYDLEAEVYRVLEVDPGQLADGAITVRLVRDVFDQTDGAYAPPSDEPVVTTLLPITDFVVDESPYLLSYLAALAGALPNIGDQRLMVFAAAEPSPDPANRFLCDTQAGGAGGHYAFGTQADIGPQPYPVTAIVAVEYPRTLEPYDDATGLVIENFAHGGGADALDFTIAASRAQIRATGRHLALLGGANITTAAGELQQVGEIVSFESITDLGGGQIRLDGVGRGHGDTAPVTHPVGARFYMITPSLVVGQRDWITGQYARGYAIPLYGGVVGSDGLSYASHDVLIGEAGRRYLPLRAADMRLAGYDLDGTQGPQADPPLYPRVGELKAVSRLEGAFDVDARENRIDAGVVVFGDETTWSAETGTTWTVAAEKVGGEDGDVALVAGLTTPTATGLLLGEVGHGEIDVRLDSYRAIGLLGGKRSWQSPTIRVTAPHWRDLLANSSFEYGALEPGWAVTAGTPEIETGTDCLPRYPAGGFWLQGAGGDCAVEQIVDVSGYKPIGLVATVSYYARNFFGGAKAVTVTVRALDAADVELDTASDSVIGPADHWQRDSVGLLLPADTAKVAVAVEIEASVDLGGHAAGATRIRLRLDQGSGELLTNPSFDGNLTSWTNVTNSFALNTTNPYSSRNGTIGAAQGGAFATSEIKQEVSIPAGYEYGTALLQLARSTVIDGDAGTVTLEALDGGGTVLASETTGAEADLVQGTSVLDVWERRRLPLQLPDGAATMRVRLIAARAAGAGNSGACFDDLSLVIHKDLDPAHEWDFDFREPSWQPLPKNWQQFYLVFGEAGVPAPFMSWDGSSVAPMVQQAHALVGPTFAWSDASTPAAASFRGFWDVGPHIDYPDPAQRFALTTSAYQVTRAIAGSAVDLQASGPDDTTADEYGAFDRDEPFTIAIMFRTDEPTWSGAAGLIGRRGATGLGWGMRLDASGRLQVVLQGASGTATVTGTSVQADGAPHWGFLVNDPGTDTLYLYSDTTADWFSPTSTAAIGSIAVAGVPLRIGRDGPASATGGVQIARAFIWDVALDSGDVLAMLRYGKDPSELSMAWTSNRAVWTMVPDHSSISDGVALLRYSPHHVPIGSAAGDYGVATAAASTNKIPSNDFTVGATWSAETGATLTQSLVDCTGLPRGVRVTNGTADKGLRCLALTMGAGTPLGVVLFARTTDGVARDLVVELRDAGDVLIDSETVALGDGWDRYHVQLGPWAASTPTAYLRFMLGGSALGSFDLAHVMWAAFGTDAPLAIQDAGLAIATTGGRLVPGLPIQGNYEGEILVAGASSVATPPAGGLASIDDGSTTTGARSVEIAAAGVPRFAHVDDTPTTTNTDGTAITWSDGFELRARWNRLELPESVGDQVGLVVDGSPDSATYAALAFAVGANGLVDIRIGGGGAAAASSANAILHRVRCRMREPKLGG
jgi:hypothetical protein